MSIYDLCKIVSVRKYTKTAHALNVQSLMSSRCNHMPSAAILGPKKRMTRIFYEILEIIFQKNYFFSK